MSNVKELAIEEWKVSMHNARHFNDLIIRFRVFGLPLVVTLAAAALASAQVVGDVELWKWAIPMVSALIASVGVLGLVWHTLAKMRRHGRKSVPEGGGKPEVPFHWMEFLLWMACVLPMAFFAGLNIYDLVQRSEAMLFRNVSAFPFTPIAVFAALNLLTALYLMDRFYYYKLLMGAVDRARELEEELGFRITETTSAYVPEGHATNLVTAFYCLPALVLIAIFCATYKLALP